MTHSVTKAMPIQFIDSKNHIKKWKGHKTALSGYYTCLSRDLLLMPSGADTHTHTPTFTDETILRNLACAGLQPGLKNIFLFECYIRVNQFSNANC